MRSPVHVVVAALVAIAIALSVANTVEGASADEPSPPHGADLLTEVMESSGHAVTARRVDARLIAEWDRNRGFEMWRHGRGDEGHTWRWYKTVAARLRAYLRAVDRAKEHEVLVWHWAGVAHCESSGNWAINTGNGYYGGLQFSLGTWRSYGGQGMPQAQPAWYQATIADRVRTRSGLHHWPVCGRYYR